MADNGNPSMLSSTKDSSARGDVSPNDVVSGRLKFLSSSAALGRGSLR